MLTLPYSTCHRGAFRCIERFDRPKLVYRLKSQIRTHPGISIELGFRLLLQDEYNEPNTYRKFTGGKSCTDASSLVTEIDLFVGRSARLLRDEDGPRDAYEQ